MLEGVRKGPVEFTSRGPMVTPRRRSMETPPGRRGASAMPSEDRMPLSLQMVGAILDATVVHVGLVPAHLEEMNDKLEELSHRESPGAYPVLPHARLYCVSCLVDGLLPVIFPRLLLP